MHNIFQQYGPCLLLLPAEKLAVITLDECLNSVLKIGNVGVQLTSLSRYDFLLHAPLLYFGPIPELIFIFADARNRLAFVRSLLNILSIFSEENFSLCYRRIGDVIEAEVAMIKLQKGKSGEFFNDQSINISIIII